MDKRNEGNLRDLVAAYGRHNWELNSLREYATEALDRGDVYWDLSGRRLWVTTPQFVGDLSLVGLSGIEQSQAQA